MYICSVYVCIQLFYHGQGILDHISELDPTHRSDRIVRNLHLSVLRVVLVLKEMTTWLSHPRKYDNMYG